MQFKRDVDKLYCLLALDNRLVGVRFVYTKEDYDKYQALECKRPIPYCGAVRAASKGHGIKITKQTAGCAGSNKSIGFAEPPESFFSGEAGKALGLYETQSVAAQVARAVPMMPMGTYGIVVKPLENFEFPPQVVLIICNPREMMRVMQGYTYTYGLASGISFSGNRAVCVESTVTPIVNDTINVSVFCGGTRFRARWNDNDMMVGIPVSKFHGTVNGILQTVNPMELDGRKEEIERGLRHTDNLDVRIVYGKTYFKDWDKGGKDTRG